ncbi:hypothetical protein WME79_37060 [Sorangium sp. So ce726]|uniref:hypothetical protein n=1 Tax=Sorangium sp. So ce726 TaxID=3133319 RepID=UPI003F5E1C0F
MKPTVRLALALGLALSSLTTACIQQQTPLEEHDEDVGEVRAALGPTLLECDENYQDYEASCHDLPDRSDFRICVWFAKEAYKNCCREAGGDCDDGLPVGPIDSRVKNDGGGFHAGFGGDEETLFDPLVPDP